MFLNNRLNQVPNFSNLPKVHNIIFTFYVHILTRLGNARNNICDYKFCKHKVLSLVHELCLDSFAKLEIVDVLCHL